MIFHDLLYGRIKIPDWLTPFLRIPEFTRLRNVRLSNSDSIDFKDFGRASRWEHAVGVAYLAGICARKKNLSKKDRIELTLAALLHDIATPPFAHTVENVLSGFDHERETQKLLGDGTTDYLSPDTPVYLSALPEFREQCLKLSKSEKVKVDPDNVAKYIVGDGALGFLISGTLDLDNADNVTRGATLMGLQVDKALGERLASWLGSLSSPPTDLDLIENTDVQDWLACKKEYYFNFFDASEWEHGRQAFLQHLIRSAIRKGLSHRALIWNTDEGLLDSISQLEQTRSDHKSPLNELVNRYKLLEPASSIGEINICDSSILNLITSPAAIDYIERKLQEKSNLVFVLGSKKKSLKNTKLFEGMVLGKIRIYKLGTDLSWEHLPNWMTENLTKTTKGKTLKLKFIKLLEEAITGWSGTKPWLQLQDEQIEDAQEALNQVGDWSFRLSKNETLHSYPSTFVHAIPATLIDSLGLKGGTILDPFGGTGQTAFEAVKAGGIGISGDINFVANLTARVRLSFIGIKSREFLRSISPELLKEFTPIDPPVFQNIEKWHHPKTLRELCQIKAFLDSYVNNEIFDFLQLCFSAVLTSATARKGKQHGWFADNTPLPRDMASPPYQNIIDSFILKVKSNLCVIERNYSFFERRGLLPKVELTKAKVVKANIVNSSPDIYGVNPNSVDAIITSPPYLCMTDYALGQRLSYYWLNPKSLDSDFHCEIGARRSRSSPSKVTEEYFHKMQSLPKLAKEILVPNGLVITILGQPVAKSFAKTEVFEKCDDFFVKNNFEVIWSTWRQIHWHRNQGYQRLRQEKITVYKAV